MQSLSFFVMQQIVRMRSSPLVGGTDPADGQYLSFLSQMYYWSFSAHFHRRFN